MAKQVVELRRQNADGLAPVIDLANDAVNEFEVSQPLRRNSRYTIQVLSEGQAVTVLLLLTASGKGPFPLTAVPAAATTAGEWFIDTREDGFADVLTIRVTNGATGPSSLTVLFIGLDRQ